MQGLYRYIVYYDVYIAGIDGVLVGFCLVYNVIIVDVLQYIVNLSAEFENTVNFKNIYKFGKVS